MHGAGERNAKRTFLKNNIYPPPPPPFEKFLLTPHSSRPQLPKKFIQQPKHNSLGAFHLVRTHLGGWVGSSLLFLSIAYYMQTGGGWVQIACTIAYVLNGRPPTSPNKEPVT